MNPLIPKLLKKRGSWLILEILCQTEEPVAMQVGDLIKQLEMKKGYGNVFFRARKLLREYGAVEFVLNDDLMKCVKITPKGRALWNILEAL